MPVLTHAQLEQVWVLAGGSQATADTAAAIAQAESGGDTSAILNTAYPSLPGYHPPATGNLPEYSVGLWQINELAHPQYTTAQLLGATGNANAAVAVASGGASFRAWSTYKSGTYKSYLTSGGTPAPQQGTIAATVTGLRAASALGGYADFRNSISRHAPTQIQRSQAVGLATLRLLHSKSRVCGRSK